MGASTAEIEFLATSDHRVGVLDALTERPRDRNELYDSTGASPSTMGRILADFEGRRWIARDGRTYELTRLGEFVAERFADLRHAMTVERTLRDVWRWLPVEMDGFDPGSFTDPVVSRPGPGYPYEPVERVTHLIEETATMRGFGMAMLKSRNLEAFFDRVLDDLVCEYVYPPAVFEEILSWDRVRVEEATARGNYTASLHDGLPIDEWCGVCLLDERVSFCCYDPETRTLRALVDTDSPGMYEWAGSLFERYRRVARPLEGGTSSRRTPSRDRLEL